MSSPPPAALLRPTRTEETAAGRRGIQAARGRAVLAQCQRCGCNGTARVNLSGRIQSINLAATFDRGRVLHRDCGGTFEAFDIEVDA